jgi:hypothetical protein
MKRVTLAMVLVFAAACEAKKVSPEAAAASDEKDPDKDERTPAEIAAATTECLRLEDHVFEIMPRPETGHGEPDPKRRAALVAQLPVEDIDQCVAVKDRKAIACMLKAADEATMRACIPPPKK